MAILVQIPTIGGDAKLKSWSISGDADRSPIVHSKLRRAGMSEAGIRALTKGRPPTSSKDWQIVRALVSAALRD